MVFTICFLVFQSIYTLILYFANFKLTHIPLTCQLNLFQEIICFSFDQNKKINIFPYHDFLVLKFLFHLNHISIIMKLKPYFNLLVANTVTYYPFQNIITFTASISKLSSIKAALFFYYYFFSK